MPLNSTLIQKAEPIKDFTCSPSGHLLTQEGAFTLKWQRPGDPAPPDSYTSPDPLGGCLAFSPDGQTIAASTRNHQILLLGAQDNPTVMLCTGHTSQILSLCFHPHLPLLVSTSDDQTLRVWDVHSGEQQHLWPNMGHVKILSFVPDGTHLLVGRWDRLPVLYLFPQGEVTTILQGPHRAAVAVAVHPEGHLYATGDSEGNLCLWEQGNNEPLHQLLSVKHHFTRLAFSPDGKSLACNWDRNTVRIFEVESMQCTHILPLQQGSLWHLMYHPTRPMLLALGSAGGLQQWDLQHDPHLLTLPCTEGTFSQVAFRENGTLVASTDQAVWQWDLNSMQPTGRLETPFGVQHLGAAAESAILVTADGGGRVNTSQGTALEMLTERDETPTAVAISPMGNWVACAWEDALLQVWDLHTRTCAVHLTGPKHGAVALRFSPDGSTLAFAGWDGNIQLLDLQRAEICGVLTGHLSLVQALVYSLDGKTLCSAGRDNTVRLWEVQTGQGHILGRHQAAVSCLALHPAGHTLVSGSFDHTLALWDIRNCTCIRRFPAHTSLVHQVAFHPQGHVLVSTGGDHTLRVWDTPTLLGGQA